MLSKQYKLSRQLFPHDREARFSLIGDALRIFAYPPAANLGRGNNMSNVDPSPRFAVVVKKKLGTGAVKRNMFKREVMRVIGRHLRIFQKLPYQKYVILPKKPIHAITNENIKEDIKSFLFRHQFS